MAAQKHTISPEAKEASNKHSRESDSTLSGIPSTSTTHATTDPDLTGVPGSENRLSDLVTDCETDIAKTVDPVSMEELEIADALLSLGSIEDDDNSQLMPVGALTNIIDAAPVPVMLDQINIDNAIAGTIEAEELDKDEANITVPVPGEDDEDATKTTMTDEASTTNTEFTKYRKQTKKCVSHPGFLENKNPRTQKESG